MYLPPHFLTPPLFLALYKIKFRESKSYNFTFILSRTYINIEREKDEFEDIDKRNIDLENQSLRLYY